MPAYQYSRSALSPLPAAGKHFCCAGSPKCGPWREARAILPSCPPAELPVDLSCLCLWLVRLAGPRPSAIGRRSRRETGPGLEACLGAGWAGDPAAGPLAALARLGCAALDRACRAGPGRAGPGRAGPGWAGPGLAWLPAWLDYLDSSLAGDSASSSSG